MFCGQLFRSPTGLLFDHVPLSCVPPWTSAGFDGLIATLMNCNVSRFRSMCVIRLGTCDSIRLQLLRLSVPSKGRSPTPKLPLHRNVRFTAVPGAEASGSPAVVEYITARPFDRPFPQPTPFVLQGISP